MSVLDSFTKWVEGEKPVPLHTEFEPIEEKKAKEKRPASIGDRQRLNGFLRLYANNRELQELLEL